MTDNCSLFHSRNCSVCCIVAVAVVVVCNRPRSSNTETWPIDLRWTTSAESAPSVQVVVVVVGT